MSNLVPFKMLSAIAVLDSALEGWTLLDVPAASVRAYRHAIHFEQAFANPPLVQVGIAGLDVGNGDNLRVRVRAFDVTAQGFVLHAETWFNTQVWSVDVSWLAIGV